MSAAKMMMNAANTKPDDYEYAIFHQPNGKFPERVAAQLRFTPEQIMVDLLTPSIGNTYSGAVPLGLSAILDIAKTGDRIFVTSYGSGAGSDAFDITVTKEMGNYRRENAPTMKTLLKDSVHVNYSTYAKYKGKIAMQR